MPLREVDRYKARSSFVETLHAIQRMVARWPETRTVLVEDAANGPAVIAMLQSVVHGLIGVTPEGGKTARAAAVRRECFKDGCSKAFLTDDIDDRSRRICRPRSGGSE